MGKSSRIFSTSNPTGMTLLRVLMELVEEDRFQSFAQSFYFDAIRNILRERVDEQAAGFAFADAARLQVKQRFTIELADSRAVSAANIVGQNLQLRLGVDDSLV